MLRRSPVLIVGSSARYLAQSACRSGLHVHAADFFGDQDTRAAAASYERAIEFTPNALARATVEFRNRFPVQPACLVYGAGFEAAPNVLRRLQTAFRLRGNRPKVLQWLSRPRRFFGLLDRLGVPYPEVADQVAPLSGRDWLYKDAAGFGGERVGWARRGQKTSSSTYLQRFVPGRVYSATFAANGAKARRIGFNELLAVAPTCGDFRYAGAVSNASLTLEQTRKIDDYIDRVTGALRLRGFNGLDFVLDQGEPCVLELNARPTATLELYESNLPAGGLVSHLLACSDELPTVVRSDRIHATAIVHSDQDMQIGAVDWPEWTSDRPVTGTRIPARAPVCSVYADGHDRVAVYAALHARRADVRVRIDAAVRDAA